MTVVELIGTSVEKLEAMTDEELTAFAASVRDNEAAIRQLFAKNKPLVDKEAEADLPTAMKTKPTKVKQTAKEKLLMKLAEAKEQMLLLEKMP